MIASLYVPARSIAPSSLWRTWAYPDSCLFRMLVCVPEAANSVDNEVSFRQNSLPIDQIRADVDKSIEDSSKKKGDQ
jgi:hypothetical protein